MFFFQRLHNQQVRSWSLLEVLEHARYAQCTDPRDKVHAPQALCLNTPAPIKIDYKLKSYLDVCKDVVRFCLTQCGSELSFLGYMVMEPPVTSTTDQKHTQQGVIMPTLVLDWSKQLSVKPVPKKCL
jgi:hypothetical protein